MTLQQLTYFLAAAEHGSFTAAWLVCAGLALLAAATIAATESRSRESD